MAAKAAEPAEKDEKEEVVRGGKDAHLGRITDSHFMIYRSFRVDTFLICIICMDWLVLPRGSCVFGMV